MRRLNPLMLTLLTVASLSVMSPAQSQSPRTHNMREAALSGQAQFVERLPGIEQMSLVLVLPLRNQDELNKFRQDVYDPSSPSYHQFLTIDQFTERFGPTQSDYDAYHDLFRQANAQGITVLATSECGARGTGSFPASLAEVTALAISPETAPFTPIAPRPAWQSAPGTAFVSRCPW